MLLNRLNKNKSLRIVNLLGLSVIFASLLLSYSYIRKEFSYDRFNKKRTESFVYLSGTVKILTDAVLIFRRKKLY